MTDDLHDLKDMAARLGASMKEADLGGPDVDPDTLLARGWIYKDLPKLDTRLFDLMLKTFGEGEYKLLSQAEYAGGTLSRGQILLSPKASENLAANAATLSQKATEFDANPLVPSNFRRM